MAYEDFRSRMLGTGRAITLDRDYTGQELAALGLALNPFESEGIVGGGFGKSPTIKAGTVVVPNDVYNQLSPQTSGGNFFSDLGTAFSDLKGGGMVAAAPFAVNALAPAAAPAIPEGLGGGLGLTPAEMGSFGPLGIPTGASVPAIPEGLGAGLGLTPTEMSAYGPALPTGASLAGPGVGGAGAAGAGVGTKSILDQAKDIAKTASPYAPLIGAAIGAGAGALGGGSKPAGNITIEEGIPDWLKSYIKPTLDKYSTDIQNYQTDPYGVMPAAQKQFLDTINGQFLDPSTNKWLPEYFKLGAERVKGTLSPSFGYMQAFGGNTGYNEALSRGLADLAVGLYGGAYDKERQLQNQAITSAPSFLGTASQAQFSPMADYIASVSGLGKQKTQPYFQNTFANTLGGALAGAGIGSMSKGIFG